MLTVFSNNLKCRMCGEDLSNVHFKPKLWDLRPVIKGTKDAVKISAWPETYAHVKEYQETWLASSSPLLDSSPQYPMIPRKLLRATNPALATKIGATQDVEERLLG